MKLSEDFEVVVAGPKNKINDKGLENISGNKKGSSSSNQDEKPAKKKGNEKDAAGCLWEPQKKLESFIYFSIDTSVLKKKRID